MFAGTLVIGTSGAQTPGMAPRASGAPIITEYAIPTSGAGMQSITSGPNGDLWFTESYVGKIGKITPQGVVTEFTVPPGSEGAYGHPSPEDIVAGPDGNLWFTDDWDSSIWKMTPLGQFTEYPQPSFRPLSITSGPDGDLWFTCGGVASICKITTKGVSTEFTIPSSTVVGLGYPEGITAGPDGNLWFTDFVNRSIWKMTPLGQFTQFVVPTNGAAPSNIAAGPDGNLWFTDDNGQITKVTIDGVITQYTIPINGYSGGSLGIAAGPDGNMWFADGGGSIGRVTPQGVIIEYKVPSNDHLPYDIAAGPDGNMWFVENSDEGLGNDVGRITTTTTTTTTLPPTTTTTTTTVTTTPSVQPDFTFAASPPSQSVAPGSTAQYTISWAAVGGYQFAGNLNATISGVPAGVTYSSPGGTGSAVWTFSTSANTKPGSYTLTWTATDGAKTHSTSVTLIITGSVKSTTTTTTTTLAKTKPQPQKRPPLKAAVYHGTAALVSPIYLEAANPGELVGGSDWVAQLTSQGPVVIHVFRSHGHWTAAISIKLTGGLSNFVTDGGDGSCTLLAPNDVGGTGTLADTESIYPGTTRAVPWSADFVLVGMVAGAATATCSGDLGPNGVAGNTYTPTVDWAWSSDNIGNFIINPIAAGHKFTASGAFGTGTARLTLSFPK